jgi:hypothetical protein
MQKISPIKQRILLFADTLNISKRDFYKKTGISRGTLESPTGITEETIAKFLATYQNISPEWLLTGSEPMLAVKRDKAETNNPVPPGLCQQCELRERLLHAQEEQIRLLNERLSELKACDHPKSKAMSA